MNSLSSVKVSFFEVEDSLLYLFDVLVICMDCINCNDIVIVENSF